MKEDPSVFIEYFGDYPLMRVLNFLLTYSDYDYSMTEIAKNSNVGWSTFNELWPGLNQRSIVTHTRKVGNAKLYKLNTGNPWVKNLIQLDNQITKTETDKLFNHKTPTKPKKESSKIQKVLQN
ncbi:MAG: hypothetical protein AABX70_07360 [Nanoarchaeota archaeon]